MKNKCLKIAAIFSILALVYFLTNEIGFCAAETAQNLQSAADAIPAAAANSVAVRPNPFIKFLWAIGGVVLSSVVIFVLLFLYNKFSARRSNAIDTSAPTLNTPNNVNDAVVFFINKNRPK